MPGSTSRSIPGRRALPTTTARFWRRAFRSPRPTMAFLARNARVLGDVVGKFMGVQVTGGSSTVADAYEKMRVAGAMAREVLLLAAARQTGIPKADLRTQNGAVITPDGRSLSYASLAATAAKIDPPGIVTLKPESEWRYLGKPMSRIDMVAKCTGTAIFGIDLRMPGMVYATVRTNPRLGGSMKGYDASAAATSKWGPQDRADQRRCRRDCR